MVALKLTVSVMQSPMSVGMVLAAIDSIGLRLLLNRFLVLSANDAWSPQVLSAFTPGAP